MRIDIRGLLEVFAFIALLVVGGLLFSSIKAHAKATARAEQATGRTMEAARLARTLADSAKSLREISSRAILVAEGERRRADNLADSLAVVGAVVSVEATETGESLGEAVEALQTLCEDQPCEDPADTVQVRLTAHLEADQRVSTAFQRQIGALVDSRIAADTLITWWTDRSLSFERALDASQTECKACRVEADSWRAAASPSFLRSLWGDLPKMAVTAGIVLLLSR